MLHLTELGLLRNRSSLILLAFSAILLLVSVACAPSRPEEPDVSAPKAETYAEVLDLCAEKESEIDSWGDSVREYQRELSGDLKYDGYFVGPGKSISERKAKMKQDLWQNCREAEKDYVIIRQERTR